MPKVLVADDSIAVRKVAERLLMEAGMGVALAANGEEALAFLAKEVPDLIVSDVIMPDKSGYEVCAFVRAQTALANTPVLLISGIVNDEVTKQAESCHADGVLKKPFQGTSLKDRVLELLAKKQSPPAAAPTKQPSQPATQADAGQVTRVGDEQLEVYRQAAVKLKQVEEELQRERLQSAQLTQRVAQFESQSVEQAAQAKKAALELAAMTQRAKELESLLKQEREQFAQIKKQAADLQSLAVRAQELEGVLLKERAQAAQLTQRMNEMQKAVGRVQELEAALNAERQAATKLVQQMTAMEKAVARSQELAQQFAREQQRVEELTRRLSETESGGSKAKEVQQLLETERERNAVLARRVSETEQAAQQATKRFEEMAKKLGEIAGLASQLGNGSKRS
ncbi:MAG TPA: response regulator [Nitrospira sp.]|nr:response regulator [Nitrospira sp.]